MTLSIGRQNKRAWPQGFTLIELILVMALLVILVSLVTPKLEQFFEGRTMESEVNRFMSLTRYAQSRAVSEGLPMVVWVDPKAGKYGLLQESGYTDPDGKALTYDVGNGLKINVGKLGAKAPATVKRSGFHFSPDGNVIVATSVAGVSIQEGNQKPVWIVPSTNGLSCEIRN
jgi:prepilin-type N-terminal cleavage/methylation domain-containing protein